MKEKEKEEIIGCLPKERWISAEQLALYLNVDKKTLKRHIEKFGISRVVIAGKWMTSIADFESVARK